MSTNIPIGERMDFGPAGEEIFFATLELQRCPSCNVHGYGLVVAGRRGAWWIYGACNAFEVATLKPAKPTLRRVK